MEVQCNLEQFRELFLVTVSSLWCSNSSILNNDCKAFSLTLCVSNWQGTSLGHLSEGPRIFCGLLDRIFMFYREFTQSVHGFL